MKIGLVFPQTEFGNDPIALRDYAQTAEGLGFSHILAYDHVLGANPDRPGGWRGPYTFDTAFHEPFVLFSFMAAVTKAIEFVTGIIILPQRQTALVAKQAATLDVLSGGRTRLGMGIGWNPVEYTALNQDFKTRGRRIEEQVEVLRLLWTQQLVTYEGRWHTIPDAGLKPLPVQQPIPIWFGGHAEPVLRRVGRLGDGWMPTLDNPTDAVPYLERIRSAALAAGRDPAQIGMEPCLKFGSGDPQVWSETLEAWRGVGASHASINTMGHGFDKPAAHLAALRTFAEAMRLS
jgi:probable F420-dependent oxidoreductase